MASKQSMIDKIHKCFALSESNNPNEAAAALRKAKKLMAEHQITETDLAIASIKESSTKAGEWSTPPSYIACLARMITDYFEVRFYCDYEIAQKGKWRIETYFVFVGFEPNAEIARYSFDVLHRMLKKGRKNYLAGIHKNTKKSNKTKRADDWCYGFVAGVSLKLKALPKIELKVLTTDSKALVPVHPLDAYMDQKELVKITQRKVGKYSKDSTQGYVDGSKVALNAAMNENKENQLLIE